jgi:cysteine desulfurase
LVVKYLRACADGQFDLDQLSEELDGNVLLVSASLVNSEIGTIQNLEAIGAMVRHYGALLHCDAAQVPCAMDVSVVSKWANLISLSAHKMYGPKDIGALYIRRDIQSVVEPIIHGGGQQRNLRPGTLPTPLCVGFGAAAELLSGPDAALAHLMHADA